MNIPKYWAEYTLEVEYKDRTTKIRRYGWSDTDKDAAKAHALERCQEAKETLLTTGKVHRIEGKKRYDEVPIREQIIDSYDELNAKTSINSYGVTCLNVKDVMILDIDQWDLEAEFIKAHPDNAPRRIEVFKLALYIAVAFAIILVAVGWIFYASVWILHSIVLAFTVFLLALYLADSRNTEVHRVWLKNNEGHNGLLDKVMADFFAKYPDAKFNLYETPLGYRLIALHGRFQADSEFTQQCFDELPVDNCFVRMCKVQDCFRARVTGKPWRMGISEKLVSNFWQEEDTYEHSSEELKQRQQWLDKYNQVAADYRACKFVECIGNTEIETDEHVAKLVALHDELTRCHQELPSA